MMVCQPSSLSSEDISNLSLTGKHDVGHLHTSSAKGRHSQQANSIGASGSRPGGQRAKSRNSVMRRTD